MRPPRVALLSVGLSTCLAAGLGLAAYPQSASAPAGQQVAGPRDGVDSQDHHRGAGFAGFDKNDYPGDDLLAELRRHFAFTGYWLNNPPGMASNPWIGKRGLLRSRRFGFAILFNGRLDVDLKDKDAAALGLSDADAAIKAAAREGFPSGSIIFLDQEEGGHLLPEQADYLFGWVDAVARSSYGPGVYCSGIAAGGVKTADEISWHYTGAATVPQPVPLYSGQPSSAAHPSTARGPALWVANDQCPPAPGCLLPQQMPEPATSGSASAAIWQYAQSPRRAEFTALCAATYYSDQGCHVPGLPRSGVTAVDLNTATSADPSHGR